MSGAGEAVRGALALRRWAVGALAGAPVPPPEEPSAAAWSLFLRVERCATPLSASLRGAAIPLPAHAAAEMVRRETREVQRALSARALMARLGVETSRRGIPVAVLKGGEHLARGGVLDVADVDLLAVPERADEVGEALADAGFVAAEPDVAPEERRGHELAPRVAEGSVHAEVHYAVPLLGEDPAALLARAEPLPGMKGLLRLDGADHLRHLVLHAAVQHPFRRGRLRDLVLLADALRRGPAGAVAPDRLHPLAPAHRQRMDETLAMAGALAAGRVPADPFTVYAAANYLLAHRLAGAAGADLSAATLTECAFVWLGGPGDWRDFWAMLWDAGPYPSRLGALAAMQRRFPRAGRAVRTALRVARLGAGLAAAAPFALRARGLARG